MTYRSILAAIAGVGLIAGATHAQDFQVPEAPAAPGENSVRIGTFNAQAVYAQYPGQQAAQQELEALQAQLQEAAQAQDHQRAQEIQQQAQQVQDNTVQEFFQTVRTVLPDVAAEAGVQVVAQQIEFTASGVEEVDLTRAVSDAVSEASPAQQETPGFPAAPPAQPPQ